MDCDKCDQPAVANFQKDWVRYPVTPDGDYGEAVIDTDIEEPTGDENLHLCEVHEEQFLDGELA